MVIWGEFWKFEELEERHSSPSRESLLHPGFVIWENSILSNQNPSCHFGRGASKPPTTWRSWSATARELCPDPKDNPSFSFMHPPSLSPKTRPRLILKIQMSKKWQRRFICLDFIYLDFICFGFICLDFKYLDFTCFARKSELFSFSQYISCAWARRSRTVFFWFLFNQVSVFLQLGPSCKPGGNSVLIKTGRKGFSVTILWFLKLKWSSYSKANDDWQYHIWLMGQYN